MSEGDSATRDRLVENGDFEEDEYHPVMRTVHEKNNHRIKDIILEYGWPGISLVCEDGADAAWFVVQHAVSEPEFQERFLVLLRDAVLAGQAKGLQLAMLHDRVLIQQGKPQIYGSQRGTDGYENVYPLPITDPENVDQGGKKFDSSPFQNIQSFFKPTMIVSSTIKQAGANEMAARIYGDTKPRIELR